MKKNLIKLVKMFMEIKKILDEFFRRNPAMKS